MLEAKAKMRKDMLQKVEEIVSNFRKLSDSQMAETTKRVIKENLEIRSQLAK